MLIAELSEAIWDGATVKNARVVDEGAALALSGMLAIEGAVAKAEAVLGGFAVGATYVMTETLLLGDKRLLVDGGEVKLAAELNDELGVDVLD